MGSEEHAEPTRPVLQPLSSSDEELPSQTEQEKKNADLSAPPNGGIQAWLQVFSSFLIFFNVLGLLNTYGQFQTIYQTDILKKESSSTIAWIGSVQFLICYVTCIFTGPVWDSGRLHVLIGAGTVIMVFGLMMVSLCVEFYQFFLAQAIVTGVGFGFVFMPASAIVSQWFSTKGPFAVGVATTGSSIGISWSPSFTRAMLIVIRCCHLSHHPIQASTEDRLWLDRTCHSIHSPSHHAHRFRPDAHARC